MIARFSVFFIITLSVAFILLSCANDSDESNAQIRTIINSYVIFTEYTNDGEDYYMRDLSLFDKFGQLIIDGLHYNNWEQLDFEYDEFGNVIEISGLSVKDRASACVWKMNLKYNEQGRVIDMEGFTSNTLDNSISEIEYTLSYNANGQLEERASYDENGNYTFKASYDYDSQGNRTEEFVYNYGYESKTVSSYDSNGLLIEEKYYSNEKYLDSVVLQEIIKYDEKGELIESTKYYHNTEDGNPIVNTAVIDLSYTSYDSHDNWIECQLSRSDSPNETTIHKRDIAYYDN